MTSSEVHGSDPEKITRKKFRFKIQGVVTNPSLFDRGLKQRSAAMNITLLIFLVCRCSISCGLYIEHL